MASSPDRLTPLQRDILLAFFEREQGFFHIEDTASLPAGVSAAETRAFLENLVERMAKAAAPLAK